MRIFNTYGPRMRPDDGRVVTNFIVQALRGEPLTLYGDGSQTRSFCYVDDEVDGLLALLDSSYVGPVNIGNPDEFTVAQFAELVIEITGSKSPVEYRAAARKTTRCNGSPTSRWHARARAGNPRSMSGKGSPAPSTGSAGISLADRSFSHTLTVDVTLDLAADALVVATLAIAAGRVRPSGRRAGLLARRARP